MLDVEEDQDGFAEADPCQDHPSHSVGPSPGTPADLAWFSANPDRRHRVSDGRVRRLVSLAGLSRVATLPTAILRDPGEDAAAEAFARSAVAWLATLSRSPTPPEDLAWFASRPERSHRIRPALPTEVAGRPRRTWGTIVARVPGGLVRLCLDEATLPRTDRGEGGLARILAGRASSLASGAALSLSEAPPQAEAALRPPPKPARERKVRAARAPETRYERLRRLFRTPGRPGRPPERKREPVEAGPARAAVERWQDRLVARASARSWPCLGLAEAVGVATAMRERYGRLPMRAHDARRICAEADGDDGGLGMAALKAYDLVATDASGMTRLSGTAHDILDGDPAYRPAALARAAASPAAFRRILDDFGRTPSLDDLLGTPVTGGMDDAEVAAMRERFLATMAFAHPSEAAESMLSAGL